MITRLVETDTDAGQEVVVTDKPFAAEPPFATEPTFNTETPAEAPLNRLPAEVLNAPASLAGAATVRTSPADYGVKDLARVFKLLSDETRLKILVYLIQHGELHVRALCDRLGQSQPAVSHHLALLRVAGLVDCRRAGKHNFYRVLPDRFQRLLDVVFETVPATERQIRFQDYELRQTRGE